MTMRAPTQRELDALSAIAAHVSEHGFPPTQLELARMLGVSGSRAAQLLAALDRLLLIEITGTAVTARGIRITDAGALALLEALAATVTTSTSASPRVDISRAGVNISRCRACGCSDNHACAGGCGWANPQHTLCSTCKLLGCDVEVL